MSEWLEKLALQNKTSHLGEFYIAFGSNVTEKLVTIFGGTRIEVPRSSAVLKIKRDLHIFRVLVTAKSLESWRAKVLILSRRYRCSKVRVTQIYEEMKLLDRRWKRVVESGYFRGGR